MKFSIKRNELIKNLEIANKAISGSSINEILKGFKLVLTESQLIVIGSSTDFSIKATINKNEENKLEVIETGEVVVASAVYFTDIVKRLSGENIDFEVINGNQIKISSMQAEYLIPSRSAANFPALPTVDSSKTISILSPQFLSVINETIRSAGTKDSRPIFNGLHLVLTETQLKGVATDSHRLAQKVVLIDNGSDINAVVPYKTISELKTLLEKYKQANVQFDENYLAIELENIIIYSQLISGDFPDTDRLIPEEYSTKISVDVKEFLPVIERATLAARQSNNSVITLTFDDNKLNISTRPSESGTFNEQVELRKFEGEELQISMNPDFVRDALASLNQDIIEIGFTGSLKPFVFKPLDSKDNSDLQLITPVRTINN